MKTSILAKNFKKLRHFKSMNQEEFAELIGVKRASVGSYEEGRAEPKLEVLMRLADHFKLKVDDIIRKELTVNQIAGFRLPEDDPDRLKEIVDKLTIIENRLKKIESNQK